VSIFRFQNCWSQSWSKHRSKTNRSYHKLLWLTVYRHDSKGVFSEGFGDIQTKLDEKFYTSVQTFSEDMAAVFSQAVDFATITNVQDAENQLSDVAHSSLTSEQKEKKKLAKRIIKAIKPLYEDALQKESDLAGRPLERELPDLEALLDQKLARRPTSASGGDGTVQPTTEIDPFGMVDNDGSGNGVASEDAEGHTKNNTVHLAPTPDDNPTDQLLRAQDDADEAAIAAQLGQDMDIDHEDGHGSAPGAGVTPLTPPRSEKDLLAPFAHGGIPWYMEPFDPVGTTIHDESWSGRDVLRQMSEELSELDDDELNGLADPEEVSPTDGTAPETNVSDTRQKQKQKKRWRGFR